MDSEQAVESEVSNDDRLDDGTMLKMLSVVISSNASTTKAFRRSMSVISRAFSHLIVQTR
jgi:hypothetical protein